jgi:hypothetical protein
MLWSELQIFLNSIDDTSPAYGRDRERDRERSGERERETERESDRDRERDRESERDEERDGERQRKVKRETERLTERGEGASPAWTQKWSMPLLKSGMYMDIFFFDPIILKKYFTTNETTTLNCSENGKTSGPTAVKFFSIACPATFTISLLRRTPVL